MAMLNNQMVVSTFRRKKMVSTMTSSYSPHLWWLNSGVIHGLLEPPPAIVR